MTAKLDVSVAKMQHEMWRNKLITFLNGGTVPDAVSHRDCNLGKWIYGTGMDSYGSVPEMRKLEQEHQEYHDRIRKVIDLQQAGDKDQAWNIYQSLKPMSGELEDLLDSVGSKVS